MATFAIYEWIEPSISLLFFPAIVILAMYAGYGPALLATVLSTVALAFFFVPPRFSLHIGIDDAIRLAVFTVVAVATASVSSARKRAEDAQRKSLHDLQQAANTLRKVSGWPVLIGPDASAGARTILRHAATVVGAQQAVAVWEAGDEPWVYIVDGSLAEEAIAKHPPTALAPLVEESLAEATLLSSGRADEAAAMLVSREGKLGEWTGKPIHPSVAWRLTAPGLASSPFRTEHLVGRAFFGGIAVVVADLAPVVELVAREVGNSLDQLYLAGRLQDVAIREERVRLARDLHDGVLQAITGIRFELQAIADQADGGSSTHDRLLAIERALAIEQRELRLFIEDVQPAERTAAMTGPLAQDLEETRTRLGMEWKTPIAIRVTPPTMAVSDSIARAVKLMVHEAIVNAMKHGHPSRVTVDIYGHGDHTLHMVICDDGRGFPFRGRLEHEEIVSANRGPASLRERVVTLGGRMAIESKVAGSRLEITVPATIRER